MAVPLILNLLFFLSLCRQKGRGNGAKWKNYHSKQNSKRDHYFLACVYVAKHTGYINRLFPSFNIAVFSLTLQAHAPGLFAATPEIYAHNYSKP